LSGLIALGLGLVLWGPGCGVERHLDAAEEALKAHDLAAAEAAYRRVLEREPESVDALYGLGWVYHLTGEPERARDYFQRCTRIAPADHRGYKGLGSVAMAQEQLAQAVSWFEQALERAPEDPAVLNSLSIAHMQGQDHEQALVFARRAVAAAPTRGEYGLSEGEALFRLKRHDEALAAIERALGAPFEEQRFRALLYVLRARVLVAMTGGRVDPEDCAGTVPPLMVYLEKARISLEQAEGIGIQMGELGAAKRRVHRRRGYITEQCPGEWGRPED